MKRCYYFHGLTYSFFRAVLWKSHMSFLTSWAVLLNISLKLVKKQTQQIIPTTYFSKDLLSCTDELICFMDMGICFTIFVLALSWTFTAKTPINFLQSKIMATNSLYFIKFPRTLGSIFILFANTWIFIESVVSLWASLTTLSENSTKS